MLKFPVLNRPARLALLGLLGHVIPSRIPSRSLARRCYATLAEQVVTDDEAAAIAGPILLHLGGTERGDLDPALAILRRGLAGDQAGGARKVLIALGYPLVAEVPDPDLALATWEALGAARQSLAALKSNSVTGLALGGAPNWSL